MPPETRVTHNVNEECGEPPDFAQYFDQSSKYRSANYEDHDLYNKLFKQVLDKLDQGGTYVEMGAFDGLQESNSRFFDICLGWDGLLIEPNPATYPGLIDNRKHAHRMSYAASCSEADEALNKTIGFHPYAFTNAAQAGTNNAYEGKNEVPVPCGSLTPVLLDLFDGRVTLFSLDVEGAEPMVLESIDFRRVRFDVIMVENRNNFCEGVCESRDKARALMVDAGYILYDNVITKSDLYFHPESEFKLDT